jgi:hypothetical protein
MVLSPYTISIRPWIILAPYNTPWSYLSMVIYYASWTGSISLELLVHLTQRVMWDIVTTEYPSSVVRPLTFHILQWTIKISSRLFFYFQLGGHLGWKSGSPDTIWKGAIQGPFHQSLVQIGPVSSEELIKMWKVKGRTTDDGRSVVTISHMTLWVRWANNSKEIEPVHDA